MKSVYVAGRRKGLKPANAVGKGGEADVYALDDKTVVKVFKGPDHPDLVGLPLEQAAAEQRLEEMQTKLAAFPTGLPARVVTPQTLATDRSGGRVLGFTMRRVIDGRMIFELASRSSRPVGMDQEQVRRALLALEQTVRGLHHKGVVLGDFNDRNVLLSPQELALIDADSFQYGAYPCRVFSLRFVDPLLLSPNWSSGGLRKAHGQDSDWYAFCVLMMRSLLFVGPYGGVYRPADPAKRRTPEQRRAERITVFDPEVRYPKPAIPFGVLPDELLQHMHVTFIEDRRGPFPGRILEDMHWTRCLNCSREHARGLCPSCTQVTPATKVKKVRVRGQVVVTQLFETSGRIVCAASQKGVLRWLAHDGEHYRREGGRVVLRGPDQPGMSFGLCGPDTLVAAGGRLQRLGERGGNEALGIDSGPGGPAFAANGDFVYRVEAGQLLCEGVSGPALVGRVLTGQTRFWVGDELGLGFYRAGEMSVAFVFAAARSGLRDDLAMPRIGGQLLDAECLFDADRAWLFLAFQQGARSLNRCLAIDHRGRILAAAEAEAGHPGWLGSLRGKLATGGALMAATDDGLLRLRIDGNQIVEDGFFPDCEPFVDQECQLLATGQGLAVISGHSITLLRMA
jgi:hypothetical protein